jgi:hypothetical protein
LLSVQLAVELGRELKNFRMERCADEKAVDMLSLERKLALRPSRDELQDKNIIKMRGAESASRLLATTAIANKIKSRPGMETLVEKGVIDQSNVDIIVEEEES